MPSERLRLSIYVKPSLVPSVQQLRFRSDECPAVTPIDMKPSLVPSVQQLRFRSDERPAVGIHCSELTLQKQLERLEGISSFYGRYAYAQLDEGHFQVLFGFRSDPA